MALETIIRQNMINALKAGNKEEKRVYAGILDALLSKAKSIQAELTPEQDIEVINKLAKQNQESIDTCPTDRLDIIQKLRYDRSIIVKFLPKQMDTEEIEQLVKEIIDITGSSTIKDKGKVMKQLMPIVKGKADGKQVNKIIEDMLK